MTGFPWTPERVETLRRLWADGLSAAQIAEAMGGLTRNSVIGKAHREKLARRVQGRPDLKPCKRGQSGFAEQNAVDRIVARKKAAAPKPPMRSKAGIIAHAAVARVAARKAAPTFRAPAPKPVPATGVRQPLSGFGTVRFLDYRNGQCAFPDWGDYGVPPIDERMVCGRPTQEGHSWCRAHSAIVYAPRSQARSTA